MTVLMTCIHPHTDGFMPLSSDIYNTFQIVCNDCLVASIVTGTQSENAYNNHGMLVRFSASSSTTYQHVLYTHKV